MALVATPTVLATPPWMLNVFQIGEPDTGLHRRRHYRRPTDRDIPARLETDEATLNRYVIGLPFLITLDIFGNTVRALFS